MGSAAPGDSGVAAGAALLAFAEAAVRGDDLAEARSALITEVGPEGAAQAAATVAAFSGLVRVADGTGIPIDDGLAAASIDIRERLELGAFGGAANTDHTRVTASAFTDINSLF